MSLIHDEWFTERYDGKTGFSVRCTQKLYEATSDFQRLEIFDTVALGRTLILDGCFMLTEKDAFVYHEMLVHPALSLVADARKVLIIGGGDGGAVTELVKYPGIEAITLCEIDPLVVSSCTEFFPEIAAGLSDPRVKVINGDGAAYVRGFQEEFDVVLVDSTDPVGPAAVLFETSFYDAVKRSLRKGGVMVCQSESPLFMEKEFTLAVRNLAQVFGTQRVWPYLANISCYPGGLWSFTLCSETRDPLKDASAELPACLHNRLQYYTADVHRAAFALPVFVRKLVHKSFL
jgi:spermidine synthase